ncbi:MAG: sigma-54 dependent transcriptional regulator [Desulfobacterales bacterium]|nr:sigma-54 dependent transcriptional regulator [Desulfobacterales bacterium]
MSEALKQLLTHKNLGTVVFDKQLRVIEADQLAKELCVSMGQRLHKGNLVDVFPELIGCEEFLRQIIQQKKNDFRLDFVNRADGDETPIFFNLLVLPAEQKNHGLLILENVTDQALAAQQMNQQRYELYLYQRDPEFRKQFLSESILGQSDAIERIRETIQKLSRFPSATVLLMGETGSGKNLAARVLHHSSMSADAPFVEINCAALPEHLIESELFGYEKGAFTHAVTSKRGLLEEARGGTLFLDEIGEMPLNMQAKLLNALETKQFRRLGSTKPIETDLRIIAATNRDLQTEVDEKRFREDLFYRLNVVSMTMPPLRELGTDIMIISEYLLKLFNVEFKKDVKGFTADARQLLLGYSWPGNVRELSNCLERAMIFSDHDMLDAGELVISGAKSNKGKHSSQKWVVPPGGIVLEEVERQLILSALEQSGKNKSKAARLLGLTRDTLRYRLDKYQL